MRFQEFDFIEWFRLSWYQQVEAWQTPWTFGLPTLELDPEHWAKIMEDLDGQH